MAKQDPRVDAYIAKSREFARPILVHFRKLVHEACPKIEETIKWGMPFFEHHGIICHMAAFKEHCAICFWNKGVAADVKASGATQDSTGHFGRFKTVAELPKPAVLKKIIKKAAKLNEEGAKSDPRRPAKKPIKVTVPADLKVALAKNKKAKTTFDGFPPGKRRDYVEWITEAKQSATRQKRLKTAIEWLAEGKSRMWKYE